MLESLSIWLLLLCAYSNGQSMESPCPDLFLYQSRDDSTDRWYGLFNLESNRDTTGFQIKLTLNSSATALTNLFGQATTYDYKVYTITNKNFRLRANSSHLIRFFVKYDTRKPAPKLVKIEKNEDVICEEAEPLPDQVFTSVFLGSINVSNIVPSSPVQPDETDEMECGTIAAQARPLIIGSQVAEVGKYPWHVAIFRKQNDLSEFSYVCGGSLISKQHVVTSAHCLIGSSQRNTKYQVHLGKTNIDDNDPSKVQIREVSNTIIHPEFSSTKRLNNIGLLKLKKPIAFTDFVRPVCLWEGDTDYEKVIGKIGITVGWGQNENFEQQDDLKVARMSLLSSTECLKDGVDYQLTRNSFCAGGRNETTCRGDSGGGLVMRRENSERETYQLRGITSHGRLCALDSITVFVDAAAYLDFIKANLK